MPKTNPEYYTEPIWIAMYHTAQRMIFAESGGSVEEVKKKDRYSKGSATKICHALWKVEPLQSLSWWISDADLDDIEKVLRNIKTEKDKEIFLYTLVNGARFTLNHLERRVPMLEEKLRYYVSEQLRFDIVEPKKTAEKN